MDYTRREAPSDRKPPALPLKQRRSTSSVPDLELEGIPNQPGSSPLPSPSIDVFAAPIDCNAALCPIHHCFGSHQGRFFSDQIPPPIPKKKLARTFSLPTDHRFSPTQLLLCHHRCKNPPHIFEDALLDQAREDKNDDSPRSELTFETPDHHLPSFFSSFCHQEQVYMGIQKRYLEFMRNTVKHLEAQVLLEQSQVEYVRTLQPQDFVLCENMKSEMEHDIFFMVNVPKVPEGVFYAKVHTKGTVPMCSVPLPCHLNIEEIVAHFSPSMGLEKEQLSVSHADSAEPWKESEAISKRHSVLFFLEQRLAVTIVRDFPWATLEEYVQEGTALQPDVYERQLSLLILQLALGLQHLESHNVKHAELRPQNVMLVWLCARNKKTVQNADAARDPKDPDTHPYTWQRNRCKNRLQTLWRKWGTPRVVITRTSVKGGSCRDIPTNGLQLGVLLKHCLQEYSDVHQNTPYTSGLLHLINHLTRENPDLQMAEIVCILQALLWGPRAGLFEKNQPNKTVLHNWLMVKRSMLVMKLAEKGLFSNQSYSDWEDYFCMHYLSLANPETVLRTTAQLGLYNNVKLV